MTDVATVEQTTADTTEPIEAPAAVSIADHARQFSPEAQQASAADDEPESTDPVAPKPPHSSEQQRRDRETGQFQDGKRRHRAQSQQASPQDVPRIRELTGKVTAAEARANALEAEVTRLKAQHAPPSQIAQAEKKADAVTDPEPNPADAKYQGDGGMGKYVADQARWATRDEARQLRSREAQADAETKKKSEYTQIIDAFSGRVDAAKTKYADFDAAMTAPAKWLNPTTGAPVPGAEALDAFIMQDDAGAEMLYYLHCNPAEVDSLLGMPVLAQVKTLALLSQRLLSGSSAQAGKTGAVATRQVNLPPKPPTPVRTEAQRAGTDPPPMDGSLSIAEHAKRFAPHRR